MIQAIISVIGTIAKSNLRNDDDIIDRLHHQYTVIFLLIFTVLITTSQYVGSPLHCWCPAYFTRNHASYTNKICWVTNTYMLPDRVIPGQDGSDELRQHIGYYQWMPIILLVQGFLFYLPCILWRFFNERSGIQVHNLVEAADTIQNALYPERRDKTIKYMIRHLDHYLDYQREYRGGFCVTIKHFIAKYLCLICGNRYGNYLVTLYLSIKVLYFINVVTQLLLMNVILSTGYNIYGFEVIRDLVLGVDWATSKRFPRVTFCNFQIRQMGTVHPHTVMCVLPINMFNEKIQIFLWFWFVFVATATCFSFIRWIWVIGFRYSRIRYVRKHLKIMDKLNRNSERDRKLSQKFAELYLKQDGVFVLKLVAKNSTDVVVADIVAALWENYKSKPMHVRHDVDMDDTASIAS